MSCFHWFKLISVLIHLKYLYYNTLSLELSCLPRHPSRISPWPTEIPLQLNLYHVLHQFPYLFLPSSITRHTKPYAKTSQSSLLSSQIHITTSLQNTLPIKKNLFIQFRLRQGTSEQGSLMWTDTILIPLFFLKVQTRITRLTITYSYHRIQSPIKRGSKMFPSHFGINPQQQP